jgi:putative transposase
MSEQRKAYPSDLSDTEWKYIEPLIPPAKPGGRSRTTDMQEVVNAIFYMLRGGCAWRMMPHEFPPWQTVYHYFRQWRQDGTWKRIHDTLRRQVRRQAGRNEEPSAAILDSQSVKTTEKGGFAAMTLARRSTGASDICSLTPLGWSWR